MYKHQDKVSPQPISYSINTAISATGLSRSALYKAMHDKRLPFKKYGKRTMFMASDLQVFIDTEFNIQPATLND